MSVQFFFQQDNRILTSRSRLKAFLPQIFSKQKRRFKTLHYIFCSDNYLLDINRSNLKHDYFTDIITFNLSNSPSVIEGEIYISTDRVRDNACINGVSIKEELHRVIFHGALHLCGYQDKTKKQQTEMRKQEDALLTRYFS